MRHLAFQGITTFEMLQWSTMHTVWNQTQTFSAMTEKYRNIWRKAQRRYYTRQAYFKSYPWWWDVKKQVDAKVQVQKRCLFLDYHSWKHSQHFNETLGRNLGITYIVQQKQAHLLWHLPKSCQGFFCKVVPGILHYFK